MLGPAARLTPTGKRTRKRALDLRRWRNSWLLAGLLATISTGMVGCAGGASPEAIAGDETVPSYMMLNQDWIEAQSEDALDLADVDAVFWHIFSRLPDEVTVYPSENYYYFKLYVNQRQLWGNLRLAAGRREMGVLSFAYFEFKESPYITDPRIQTSKYFAEADGLIIEEKDRFTFAVRYNRKEVIFHLHELSQEAPKLFRLGDDEVFVMRTFDESGYQWFLLFNERSNYLFWVLNEEELVPDKLQYLAADLLVGRRSGFAFFLDAAHDGRKVLAGIHGDNATVNNYYDGPFDQLADNYVDVTNVSEYLQLTSPGLRGRIDKYGYFTDRQGGSSRVAVSPYFVYFSESELNFVMEIVRSSPDPYRTISSRGQWPD